VGCPCAFVNTPDISWRMLFSWGSSSHLAVLDPAARLLQPNPFFATSILVETTYFAA
jgi:hypothetical protein